MILLKFENLRHTCAARAWANSPIFWNLTHKNIPDRQHTVVPIFEEKNSSLSLHTIHYTHSIQYVLMNNLLDAQKIRKSFFVSLKSYSEQIL